MEKVQDLGTPSFYSWLFLVPKKNGKLHPVIDLSLLNQYIRKQPFKLERVKSVRQSILVNDWPVSIDLTDAYLHVPIHPQSRKYLRFMFEDQVFQFIALPFRMSLSPWILTKLMDVTAAHLCQCASSLFPYLDKRSDFPPTSVSHKILPSNCAKSRVHSKSKEIRFDTSADIHVYRDGISDTKKYSKDTSGPSRFSTSDYQSISLSDSSFCTNYPFSFGQTQRNSRLRSPKQTSLTTASNVSHLSGDLKFFLSIIRF